MANKKSFKSAQDKAISTGFLDLVGSNKKDFKPVTFDQLAESLAYVAAVYTDKLTKQLVKKDADSSGDLADSIIALDVKILGTLYRVEIEAKKYADFVDEGVKGWAAGGNSPYSFKTKGVNPNGAMVKAVKKWLVREAKITKNTKKAVSSRESKRMSILDTSTRAAVSTAYMIKRQGIKATHFWKDATTEMDEIIRKELSAASRIDIIQNLSNN